MTPQRNRAPAAFVLLCVIVIGALGAYVAWTRGAAEAYPRTALATVESIAAVRSKPHALFRSTALGPTYGRTTLAALEAPGQSQAATPLECDRVHFAGGAGVCLAAERGVITTYRAITFDERFTPTHEMALPGVPSRVRVAPDGTRAGITVFVSGDSYAAGGFSTRALIADVATGTIIANLEDFAITRDGAPFKAADFNFWGVTFADADRFYATLATGGETYLIEGRVGAQQGRVLRTGVECPSLSPDQTRVVFKKRIKDGIRLIWRVAVLDLATMRETLVADQRSMDDQAEWLDDQHVVYGLPSETHAGSTDVWVAPADGSGAPRVLLADAWSPAFVEGKR